LRYRNGFISITLCFYDLNKLKVYSEKLTTE
jgi:hypothetical protein